MAGNVEVFETLFSDATRRATPVVPMGQAPPPFPFAYGLPDPGSFPARELVRAARSVLREEAAEALQYGNYQGEPTLREVVAERLRRLEGVDVSADAVLITNGSSDGIALVAQLLVNAGDTILVEGPTFLGAVRTFEIFGPRVVEIPLDTRGLRVDALERTLRDLARNGVHPKLLYTLPTFQNPTGGTLTLERRRRLLELAERYELPVLEDDPYGELRFDGRPVPSLFALDRSGLVLRCGTFSKILAAGLRLGWLAGPPEVIRKLVALKVDGGTNPFASRLAAAFARQGYLERHVRKLRRIYRERRDAMAEALSAHCAEHATWSTPSGGFFFWLKLHPDVDPRRLLDEARTRGVGYLPGPACYTSARGEDELRLAFSFLTPEQIRAGIRRLGEALAAARRRAAVAAAG